MLPGERGRRGRGPRGRRPRGQAAHPPRREGRAGRWRQRGEGSGPAAPASVKQKVESLPQEEGAAGAGVRSRPAPGQPRGTSASSRLSAPLGPCGRVHPGPESHHLTGPALPPPPGSLQPNWCPCFCPWPLCGPLMKAASAIL